MATSRRIMREVSATVKSRIAMGLLSTGSIVAVWLLAVAAVGKLTGATVREAYPLMAAATEGSTSYRAAQGNPPMPIHA